MGFHIIYDLLPLIPRQIMKYPAAENNIIIFQQYLNSKKVLTSTLQK